MRRRLIVCADDFGLDEAVNDAVELACRDGILTCASLMVAAPAAADAVARARRLPRLRVGLHVTLVDGRPMLPVDEIPALVGPDGRFLDDMARAGVRFFFNPRARRQLAAEIRAQFVAFQATGLALDHVNAHKHMHVHPTVAAKIAKIGPAFGLVAMRIPSEPAALLRSVGVTDAKEPIYKPFVDLLRWRMRRAGIAVNDRLAGLAWTGAMTEDRMCHLIEALPPGVTELYCHPASDRTPALIEAMPGYRQTEELAALVSPAVRAAVERGNISLIAYGDLPAAA